MNNGKTCVCSTNEFWSFISRYSYTRQALARARNKQRKIDVLSLFKAIYFYKRQNNIKYSILYLWLPIFRWSTNRSTFLSKQFSFRSLFAFLWATSKLEDVTPSLEWITMITNKKRSTNIEVITVEDGPSK